MTNRIYILFFLALVISFAANAHTYDQDEGSITDSAVEMIDTYPNQYVSGTLPVLYIYTENGKNITSKEVYINATYFVDNLGNTQFEAVGSYNSQLPMEIRGRGHSSWKGAKKPYKLKLGDKRGLFGMPKSKHWALIKPSENTVAGLQLGEIIQYDSFCKAVANAWTEVHPTKLEEIYDHIDQTILPLATAWGRDCERWGEDPTQTAEVRVTRIKYWLGRNIEWFDKHLPVSPYASMDSTLIETAPFYDIYNLQGMYLGRYDEYQSLLSRLPHGIYIINGNKLKN